MGDLGHRLGFAGEAGARVRPESLLPDQLERDPTLEDLVDRLEHDAHPSGTELRDDPVALGEPNRHLSPEQERLEPRLLHARGDMQVVRQGRMLP